MTRLKVTIEGPSRSGKTTLASLLAVQLELLSVPHYVEDVGGILLPSEVATRLANLYKEVDVPIVTQDADEEPKPGPKVVKLEEIEVGKAFSLIQHDGSVGDMIWVRYAERSIRPADPKEQYLAQYMSRVGMDETEVVLRPDYVEPVSALTFADLAADDFFSIDGDDFFYIKTRSGGYEVVVGKDGESEGFRGLYPTPIVRTTAVSRRFFVSRRFGDVMVGESFIVHALGHPRLMRKASKDTAAQKHVGYGEWVVPMQSTDSVFADQPTS